MDLLLHAVMHAVKCASQTHVLRPAWIGQTNIKNETRRHAQEAQSSDPSQCGS